MSKAEELANKTGAVCEKLRRTPMPISDVVPHMQAMADELRRLAQVEAEHEALLKAISDAEPVMVYHGNCVIDCGEHGHQNVEMLKMISAGSPLYTLNGIKP